MEENRKGFSGFLTCCAFILAFLPALFIAVRSLMITAVLDPDRYREEHILYENDNILLSIAVTLLAVAVFVFLMRSRTAGRINVTLFGIFTVAAVTVLSSWWVLSAGSIPETDTGKVTSAAADALLGNYDWLTERTSYFRTYKYQLGYVFMQELMQSVMGSNNYGLLGLFNSLALGAAYTAVILISGMIFNNRRMVLATEILLLFCLQPAFFATFLYGNMIGFAFSSWAVLFMIRFLKGERYSFIPAALFTGLAVMAKPNYWICAIALMITGMLFTLRQKRLREIVICAAASVLMIASPLVIISAVELYYEKKSGSEIQDSLPLSAWLAMGLSESDRAPGWYSHYLGKALRDNDYDMESIGEDSVIDVEERIGTFSNDVGYAGDFFLKKLDSQWQETSYESIWVSRVKKHEHDLSSTVRDIYEGKTGKVLIWYFDIYAEFIYCCFTAGLIMVILRRTKKAGESYEFTDLGALIFPLIFLGAFIYHSLFEAKSQYLFQYVPMMVPAAAYFLSGITVGKREKGNKSQIETCE